MQNGSYDVHSEKARMRVFWNAIRQVAALKFQSTHRITRIANVKMYLVKMVPIETIFI